MLILNAAGLQIRPSGATDWRQASVRNFAQSDLQSDCPEYKHLQCVNKQTSIKMA